MIFLYSNIIFFDFTNLNYTKKIPIEIDNEFKLKLYEKEEKFMKSRTKIKTIAFYYPEYNNISYLKYFNEYEYHEIIDNNTIDKLLRAQIKLAKRHNIYGFAIFFDLIQECYVFGGVINILMNKINFPFFLIWKNEIHEKVNYSIIIILINKIKKYMLSKNYIKIQGKPILSINNPNKISNIEYILLLIRKETKKKIGDIFILYPFTGDYKANNFLDGFDAVYDFSKIDLSENLNNNNHILYYSGIIYKNIYLNNLNINFPIFRTCYIDYKKLRDFIPEKFYIINKIIFEWENSNFQHNGGFIFINSWNDYQNGNYLEPDEKYGYATINSFSKSILNLTYQINHFSLNNNKPMIAIQVHVFYEDLFKEIINKINVAPFKYDLYITTVSEEKKTIIKKNLINSSANHYEIQIYENKGRDVFPFLKQMKRKIKNYKYICHIHTKKTAQNKLLGNNWREYMYNNLIGNKEIFLHIIQDFEENEKLGFIFPETYYDIIKKIKNFDNINIGLNVNNKIYMNLILKKIFKKFEVGEKLIFPVGNMFWAKTKSIYQIFYINLKIPEELNQTNDTIMHAIERIWLYLVKLNGYYYKTTFKHY